MASKNTIGPKIVADGEGEFRQAIKNIENTIKTLNSEMKVVTSQFDKNDNSVAALTAKNNILNKLIEEQKNKLSELQKGLESATKAYGANDEKTQEWQRSVNEATAKLNNMERQVKENNAAIEDGKNPTKEESDEIKNFGDQADKAGKKTLNMGDIIKANLISQAIISGIKGLASAISSVTAKISETVTASIDYASNISDMAQKTGVGAEELQKYAYAAKMSGIETETLQMAMVKSQKSFADASTGNKTLAETYKKLGIDISSISNSEDAFTKTLYALADMTDETQRNALANDIFGKSYAELAPLLNEGSKGIEELKNKASELGLVMSQNAVDSGEALGDTLDTLKNSAGMAAKSLVSTLLPGISKISESGAQLMGKLSSGIQAANGDFTKISSVVSSAVKDAVKMVVQYVPEFIKAASSIITALVQGVSENMPAIVDAAFQLINTLLQGLIGNLPMIISAALQLINALLNGIIQNLPIIIQAALEIIIQLANGLSQNLPVLIPVVIQALLTIVDTLINNLDRLIDAAIEIILALADGLLDALPRLIQKLPEIIIKIVQKLTDPDMLKKIINAGVKLFMSLVENLPQIIIELVKAIPDIINGIVSGFVSYYSTMGEIGLNLIKGIWQGISDAGAWLWDKISGFFGEITDKIKSFFGIASPSKLMEKEIGANLALGIGSGFVKQMETVSKGMQKAIPTEFDTSVHVNSRLNTLYAGNMYANNANYKTPSVMSAADIANLVVSQLKQWYVVLDGEKVGRFALDVVSREMFA